MQNKILQFFLLLFLTSCSYEAIHSKKNYDNYNFSIIKLDLIGDRAINLKIKEKLKNYTLTKKDKNFVLEISSDSKKIILAKNTSGDPTSFQSTITINVKVTMNNKFKNNFIITENFKYNNDTNKFNLKRYDRDIKNNLVETATDKIILKLSNIQ
tara:strand:+ start:614 stop:1078 length:465 start_codon:yes stop_codon:yes gene_type:complete